MSAPNLSPQDEDDLRVRTVKFLAYVSDHGGMDPGPLPDCTPDACPSCAARELVEEWTA